eukprot:13279941-Ditylum_brightwellii.AAC.1
MNEVNSDDNDDSMSDYKNTANKDGRLCWHVWDCLNIYLVANPVSFPYYIRLGFNLMCMVENGKVQDWNNVKRNVRECAEMEGAATKRNKPL